MDRDYLELKAWLEETRDEPLEAMGAFFDSRISEYEDHMSPWQKHYEWMAQLLCWIWAAEAGWSWTPSSGASRTCGSPEWTCRKKCWPF